MSPSDFRNEPLLDFRDQDNARFMRLTIQRIGANMGKEYDLVIGGKRIRTEDKIRSINPAKPHEIVGVHQKAGREHVEPAMEAALAAFESWRNAPAWERAGLAFRVADIIRQRKLEFNAWMVLEAGKNWDEAEADTCEAIDFCDLYARLALHLDQAEPLVQLEGERDYLRYIPLGVGAVIPPWNFPLAIMCGMTIAAVVCGNTVVLKPSSDTPTIAAKFFEALEEAGMPPGVVNFCPGSGTTFGHGLVGHPKTRFVAFTGSRDVGLGINAYAAQQQPGQIWIKRAILEMGGKDAIIVSDDADLDAAAAAVAASAFGFQGQKCSACSRAIVDTRVYNAFLEKLAARVGQLQIGDPAANAPMGPVINEGALKSILGYIEVGAKEGRILTGGKRAAPDGLDDGYFIEPTVIADVPPNARVAQEEIFGPVLAVTRAANFDDAMKIANGTEYGLTGAVFAASQEKVERAVRDFQVGNLYINRKCTGAMVGAHPFGGFNMSGTDSKAGGADYLYLFTQAKSIGHRI
jgi:1-pyrroline-5-carboxylate dehydrogenase